MPPLRWPKLECPSTRDPGIAKGKTYQAPWPEDVVVHDQPRLFCEAHDILLLVQPPETGKWCPDVVHEARAHAGEERDAEEHEICIVPADAVLARGFIVVAQSEELGGVFPRPREEAVGEEEEGEEVEGYTWQDILR